MQGMHPQTAYRRFREGTNWSKRPRPHGRRLVVLNRMRWTMTSCGT
jgi:hypothetical protein